MCMISDATYVMYCLSSQTCILCCCISAHTSCWLRYVCDYQFKDKQISIETLDPNLCAQLHIRSDNIYTVMTIYNIYRHSIMLRFSEDLTILHEISFCLARDAQVHHGMVEYNHNNESCYRSLWFDLKYQGMNCRICVGSRLDFAMWCTCVILFPAISLACIFV